MAVTLANIQTKLETVANHVEAAEYTDAIRVATAAIALIAAKPDSEFDDQRMEWRNAAELLELLLKQAKELKAEAQATASTSGGLQFIPVRRQCGRS